MTRISKIEFQMLMNKYVKEGYSKEEAYDKVKENISNSI